MIGSRLLRISVLLLAATWSLPAGSVAQDGAIAVSNQSPNPLLRPFVWRSIGPVGQGGRVDDIAVDLTNPFRYYVGFATGGLWRTTNNGTTFEPIFDEYETHSIGAIGIAPSNAEVIYIGTGESNNRQSSSFGAGVYKSTDGGDSFTYVGLRETQSIARVIVHPRDANTVWIAANGHLFGSNPERGLFKTTDGGLTWNHVLRIDDDTGATDLILDPSNPDKLLAATYQRRRTGCCFVGGGPGSGIWMSTNGGENWTRLEVYRDRVEVMGVGNDLPLCRQLDRGIDCILSRNDGVSQWSTGVSVAESPVLPGVLWLGTDDGNINVSRDGGATWTEVSKNLPGGTTEYYVSRVEASHFDAATTYVSIDGHRDDDLRPYIYLTRDYGEIWESISSNLPEFGNVRTVRQDPRHEDILYAGTEFGFFISDDEGQEWHRFMNGLPVVRIDDVLVHPRDNDLVLATHGRSIYVMDDITALQATTDETVQKQVHLYEPRESVRWRNDRVQIRSVTGDKNWQGKNAPAGTAIQYWLSEAARGDVSITIANALTGKVFRIMEGTGVAGLNRVQWNQRGNPPRARGRGGSQGQLAQPGVYNVTLSVNGKEYTTSLRVLEDSWMNSKAVEEIQRAATRANARVPGMPRPQTLGGASKA